MVYPPLTRVLWEAFLGSNNTTSPWSGLLLAVLTLAFLDEHALLWQPSSVANYSSLLTFVEKLLFSVLVSNWYNFQLLLGESDKPSTWPQDVPVPLPNSSDGLSLAFLALCPASVFIAYLFSCCPHM